ncbi:hypothetical protein GCM10023310_02900 [Paenibacillus vulneris]|uniref:Uncharacterized protein n=1 Tax=Paenibacillus vulneris TaxID=1133364 RepID=A0ABW3UNH4_9BACL
MSNEHGIVMVIQLNDKIMPVDRAGLYEDPLDEFLCSNNYGEIIGGGTMQSQSGEILFCDIEIQLHSGNDREMIICKVIGILEAAGAPKGSHLMIEDSDERIDFGQKEGLAVYLDGVHLPANVYAECDCNVVLEELSALVGSKGEVERYWQGNTETALYFYGDSFEEMKASISGFIHTYPLCQNARIVQIA